MKKRFYTFAIFAITACCTYAVAATPELIIPKLYLPSRNTPSGDTNWSLQNAPINNTTNDYWKMLSTSALTSPVINFGTYNDAVISLSLQSFGTISNHSDDIAVYISNGTSWTQLGTTLHTTSTSGIQQLSIGNINRVGRIKITAPKATNTVGARVISVEIKGIPSTASAISINSDSIPAFSALVGDSVFHKLIIAGANLKGKIKIQLTGQDSAQFSLSVDSITTMNANMVNEIVIKFKPTSEGKKQSTLTISSEGAVTLTKMVKASTQIATLNTTSFERIQIKEENGLLYFKADEGETAQLFGMNGQLLKTIVTIDGWNELNWDQAGVYLLRNGKVIQKVLINN